jgi:hypothetical protein
MELGYWKGIEPANNDDKNQMMIEPQKVRIVR